MRLNRHHLPIALSACLGVAALRGGAAYAQTAYSYIGVNGGSWETSTNWAPATVPGAGDTATVANKIVTKTGGTINVAALSFSSTSAEERLYVSTNTTISSLVTCAGTSPTSFSLDNAASGGTTLTIGSSATLSGAIIIGNTYGSGSNATALINNGTITGSTYSAVYGNVTNSGTIQAINGVNLSFVPVKFGVDTFTNNKGGTVAISGGGTLTLSNYANTPLTNDGTVNVTGSTLVTFANSVLMGSGSYNFNNATLGQSMTFGGTAKYYVDGTTSATSNSVLTISGGATLGGDGMLASGLSVSNTGGIVSPGHSPGTLTIGGSYTQGSGGTMLIEIGGTNAGTDYDVLNVGGAASLNGTLDISFLNGFSPLTGQVFNFFNAGSTTGSFSNIVYDNLPSGDTFSVAKNGGSFTLTTIHGAASAPEPTALALLLPALAPALFPRVRRRLRVGQA